MLSLVMLLDGLLGGALDQPFGLISESDGVGIRVSRLLRKGRRKRRSRGPKRRFSGSQGLFTLSVTGRVKQSDAWAHDQVMCGACRVVQHGCDNLICRAKTKLLVQMKQSIAFAPLLGCRHAHVWRWHW